MKKYKIVQFVEAFGGGVYTYVKDLCNFLAEHKDHFGFEIHLIYSPNRTELDIEMFHKEIHPAVFLYEIDMQRSINPRTDWEVIRKTRKILKKIQPDILHLHSAKACVIGRLACVGIVSGASVYYSPHGYSFVQKNISGQKRIFFKAIEWLMPFLFGGTTVASGNTEFELAKKISKSVLIRNGVDFQLPNELFSQPNNARLTVGTVGRLTAQKNPKEFNQIALQLPEVDFVWIGDGELIHEITAQNIKVTGWIKTREELLKKIAGLDVYIQVSLWEGLPISILEAMTMKKTLLVSDVIGNRDTVENGKNGFIYHHTEEAVEKIILLKDRNLRNEMGMRSYSKGFEEYNKNKSFFSLISIYNKKNNI